MVNKISGYTSKHFLSVLRVTLQSLYTLRWIVQLLKYFASRHVYTTIFIARMHLDLASIAYLFELTWSI